VDLTGLVEVRRLYHRYELYVSGGNGTPEFVVGHLSFVRIAGPRNQELHNIFMNPRLVD
jgi:hypothetical protein